ncbi:aspartyl/glutamyl-tRNA amidotransferase subunit C [Mycoplasma sp. Ms02]|uniref:Asp-tRNA(Asn)/Glu-tRNA(Gln) amidotransferase subunit GatC n=1 Tax=Mycoplasma sp. Ms02 TaxID=353851 RepID=UPI001C89AD3F|nr:Asp-tRNA(Asn)/Glu-tRNA(Gln) amidotransferase subunit GatC [Mycoplasma sp. Ms02]QZE12551.1 aspartyl/glutamyl-tRNA amidotransferase subunit C [Mycoplasma sp. Ms02]
MKEISKDKLKEIAKSLMLEPTQDVLNGLEDDWHKIEEQITWLDKINTDNIAAMTHIDESYQIDFLREDEEDMSWSVSKSQILENAKESDGDYIITGKVVQ